MSSPEKTPHFSQEKSELLKCYFSLQSETKKAIWLDTVGESMLTLFWRGDKARVQPNIDEFQVGQVVVFFRDNKMFAHRIVDHGPEDHLWITKGDTRFSFDRPVNQKELLGAIDCIEKKGRRYPVPTDPETGHLSATLGNKLNHELSWLPNWLKFLYYFCFFIPSYYQLKRKREKNKSDLHQDSD